MTLDLEGTDLFATVNGVRLCYRLSGQENGPPVFLIAGLGMQLVEWPKPLLDGLRAHYRVIQLDNRDMGLSERLGRAYDALPEGFGWTRPHGARAPYHLADMAADVLALADYLGISRFAVAGFSMGGMIAQHVAMIAPSRVSALLSLCSAGGTPVATGLAESDRMIERFFVLPVTRDAQLDLYCQSAEFYSHGAMAAGDAETIAMSQALLDRMDLGGGDAGGYLRQALAITDSADWSDQLPLIEAPTFVAHGMDDPCLPVAEGRRAAKGIAKATLQTYGGVGHWISDQMALDAVEWLRWQGL